MKKRDIEIGGTYAVKVGRTVLFVKIIGTARYGGWFGFNIRNGRYVRIRSPQQLRHRIDDPTPAKVDQAADAMIRAGVLDPSHVPCAHGHVGACPVPAEIQEINR